MSYAGDFPLGQTLDVKFTSRRFTTGAPFTLAGSPSVAAYPDNSTTEITAGITLSVDFDGRTGLNNVRVVATSGNGYATNTSYALVITAGTVDSVSVVGEVVGSFTIERSAAFSRLGAPAGASVSADIAAVKADTAAILVDTSTTLQGELDGIQADTEDIQTKIGTPAGASVSADVAAVKAETASIQTDTNDIQTRLPAALVSGRMDSSVGAMAANTITATALDATATAEIADANWDEPIAGHLTAGSTGAALNAAGSAGDPWVTPLPGAYGAGTAGNIVGNNLNATVSSRATQTSVDAVQADTDNIQTRLPAALVSGRIDASVGAVAAGAITAASIATGAVDADALATDAVTEIVAGMLAGVVEGTTTVLGSLRLANTANAGKISGLATPTVHLRDLADTKDRVLASVDGDGNRTAITLDLT